jgi:hypothetical protein
MITNMISKVPHVEVDCVCNDLLWTDILYVLAFCCDSSPESDDTYQIWTGSFHLVEKCVHIILPSKIATPHLQICGDITHIGDGLRGRFSCHKVRLLRSYMIAALYGTISNVNKSI